MRRASEGDVDGAMGQTDDDGDDEDGGGGTESGSERVGYIRRVGGEMDADDDDDDDDEGGGGSGAEHAEGKVEAGWKPELEAEADVGACTGGECIGVGRDSSDDDGVPSAHGWRGGSVTAPRRGDSASALGSSRRRANWETCSTCGIAAAAPSGPVVSQPHAKTRSPTQFTD